MRRSVDLVGFSSFLTVAVSVSRAVYASPCHSRLAVSSPPAASGAAPCMGIGLESPGPSSTLVEKKG